MGSPCNSNTSTGLLHFDAWATSRQRLIDLSSPEHTVQQIARETESAVVNYSHIFDSALI